jgi:hypothetical protein
MAQFIWIGAEDGYWQTASNWDDITTDQNPATIAPGSLGSKPNKVVDIFCI